jgi:hypothetical protein
MKDLQEMLKKIREVGIIPGIHIHASKVGQDDAYVTPKADPRLNLRQSFTLAEGIDATTTLIQITENPAGLITPGSAGGSMVPGRRILRIQGELISYEQYRTAPPYQFEGCTRGVWGTQAASQEASSRVGLLDVDDEPCVIITQNTNIQEEIAERLKTIYEQAGFRFVYYRGSEDVPRPYWFTVSRSQWVQAISKPCTTG